MSQFSPDCLVLQVDMGQTDPLLVGQAVGSLVTAMQDAARRAGGSLSPEQAGLVYKAQVASWGHGGETDVLTTYPDLAHAAYACQLSCAAGAWALSRPTPEQ